MLNTSPELDGQGTDDSEFLCAVMALTTLALALCSCLMVSDSGWAVMMDRRQQRLQLVLLPPSLFIPAGQDESSRQASLEALADTVHPFIIYQETSDIWINVSRQRNKGQRDV